MADRAEVARREKERLKAMEKYKREQLEKLKQDGDATASEGEVSMWAFSLHSCWPRGIQAHVRGAEDEIRSYASPKRERVVLHLHPPWSKALADGPSLGAQRLRGGLRFTFWSVLAS